MKRDTRLEKNSRVKWEVLVPVDHQFLGDLHLMFLKNDLIFNYRLVSSNYIVVFLPMTTSPEGIVYWTLILPVSLLPFCSSWPSGALYTELMQWALSWACNASFSLFLGPLVL